MKYKKYKRLRAQSLLKSLLLVALADGQLSVVERTFLIRKADIFHIKPSEMLKILKSPHKIKQVLPKDLGAKIQVLYDLVEIMLLDGVITPGELETCRKIAKKMDIMPESVELIIKDFQRSYIKAA